MIDTGDDDVSVEAMDESEDRPVPRPEQQLMLARMQLLEGTRARRQPKGPDELPEELLNQIQNPAVLDNGLPYINTAWASTNLIDSYHTRMRDSSLRNYADDATKGISLQNSHRENELPFGRTFLGRYKPGRGSNPARAEMDFYIPPNLNVNGVNSNDVIRAIDYGTARDVSIGFYGGDLRCSIDGKLMMGDLLSLLLFGGDDDSADVRDPNAPCNHLPGLEYGVRDREGKLTGDRAVAIGEVDGAHCAELSIVFDGATPMAQISGRAVPVLAKAQRMLEMDALSPTTAMALERRYRGVRFPTLTNRKFSVSHAKVRDSAGSPPPSEPAAESVPEPATEGRPMVEERAEWSTAYKNDLPDSAFAYVEPGGKKDEDGKTTPRSLRHYPHHDKDGSVDEPHLKNALARAAQNPDSGKKAMPHLERHAKAMGIGDRAVSNGDRAVVVDSDDVDFRDMTDMPAHFNNATGGTAKASGDFGTATGKGVGPGAEPETITLDPDQVKADDPDDYIPRSKRAPKAPTDENPDPDGDGDDDRTPQGDTDHSHWTPDGKPKFQRSRVATVADDALSGVRSALVAAGLAPEGFVGDVSVRFAEISKEMSALRRWADVGREARDKLVEDCKKAGVRAFGTSGFSEKAYGPVLARGSYEELQDLFAHFEEQGHKRFSGGRATTDAEPEKVPAETSAKRRVPVQAYRA
jgi:hypothetical protein